MTQISLTILLSTMVQHVETKKAILLVFLLLWVAQGFQVSPKSYGHATRLWEQHPTAEQQEEDDNPPVSRLQAVQKLLRAEQQQADNNLNRRELAINLAAAGLLVASGVAATSLYKQTLYTPTGFQRLPLTQFIAALGDPKASHGTIAEQQPWGLWQQDPGPRGVWLNQYEKLLQSPVAPAGWKFDNQQWWLEEHGLIMEEPGPLPDGRYLVTGGRDVVTGLTIQNRQWKLDNDATLYDVTHLPCRSAKYQNCDIQKAQFSKFPVRPGAEMPNFEGCSNKQDYAVLFVIGKAIARG